MSANQSREEVGQRPSSLPKWQERDDECRCPGPQERPDNPEAEEGLAGNVSRTVQRHREYDQEAQSDQLIPIISSMQDVYGVYHARLMQLLRSFWHAS